MKKAMKVMLGVGAVAAAGAATYTMLNKKTRKKAEDLADTMVKEAKSMLKR
jgi:hypothetical protein